MGWRLELIQSRGGGSPLAVRGERGWEATRDNHPFACHRNYTLPTLDLVYRTDFLPSFFTLSSVLFVPPPCLTLASSHCVRQIFGIQEMPVYMYMYIDTDWSFKWMRIIYLITTVWLKQCVITNGRLLLLIPFLISIVLIFNADFSRHKIFLYICIFKIH